MYSIRGKALFISYLNVKISNVFRDNILMKHSVSQGTLCGLILV